jgi:hypothetical protein
MARRAPSLAPLSPKNPFSIITVWLCALVREAFFFTVLCFFACNLPLISLE